MDILSITGIALAAAAIVIGQMLEGGHLSSLLNMPAFVIVIGGTTGAVLLQTPLPVFKRAIQRSLWVWSPPVLVADQTIRKLVDWGYIARQKGLLGLENLIAEEADSFSAKGLQMLVDGNEPGDIRYIMEIDLNAREELDIQVARVFEGMGGYAPTIGILGAVLGLIHVMDNLADPSKLGSGIAAAFVATVYGVGSANLIFLPVANKIKGLVRQQSQHSEMVIEGLVAIAQGENPRHIEMKLKSFVRHQ